MATNFSRYSTLMQPLTPSLYYSREIIFGRKENSCHQKGQDPLCKFKLFVQDEDSFPVLK